MSEEVKKPRVTETNTRLVYKHNPKPIPGLPSIWFNADGIAFHTQVIPDQAQDIEKAKAEGWTTYPEIPKPKSEETPDTVKVKKGNKTEQIPADQLEARKAEGWTLVEA